MVDIKKAKEKNKKVSCTCRINEKYLQELIKNDITFTQFVNQALKETFPKL